MRFFVAFLVAAASLSAATIPVITAVVNSANYRAEIASGSWATIVGTGLSNTTRAWKESDFINGQLPPELDFISVTVNGRPAFVGYISPNQINFLVPDDLVLGASTVQCAGQLLQSNFFIVNKVSYSPSLFPLTGKYAVAVHLDGTLAGPTGVLPGSATTPAKPRETVQLFGTGFGPSNPVIATGALFNANAPLAKSVTATVGGVSAQIAGYLVGPGLYQFNLTVPNLPDGDASVTLTVDGVTMQAGMFLAVAN